MGRDRNHNGIGVIIYKQLLMDKVREGEIEIIS